MAESKYKVSIGGTSQLLNILKTRRAEYEAKRDAEIQFGIDNGTITYDEQVEYLQKEKLSWYFRGSSKYQSIQNEIQTVSMQRDEVDLQYRYKTGQIDDEDLIAVRQEQLAEAEDGSQRYYSLSQEIYDLQKRKQQRDDQSEYQQHLLDYKYNYESADEHLTYLQERFDYMNGEGYTMYTDEERNDMALKISEQDYIITDLNRSMEGLSQDLAFKNGIDQLAAGKEYAIQLEDRLASERDPIEKIRIQGMIDAQNESNRILERDRQETDYRISYARHEITDEEFLDNLNALSESEINPDKKLAYQLEAGSQKRKVDEKNFQLALQGAKNTYEVNQNEESYYASLSELKNVYGADSEFGFQLDSLLSGQERRVMNDRFQRDIQGLKNQFELDQNGDQYLEGLNGLMDQYGADSVFSFELGKEIAKQTGDVEEEKFNAEMANISNKLLLGEMSEVEYQSLVKEISGKYDFTSSTQYQTKLGTIISESKRNEMENGFNTKMADLENKFKRGELNSKEYQTALEDVQNNADSYGFGSLLNIPTYSTRMDNVLSDVTSDNLRRDMQSQIDSIKNSFQAKDITHAQYLKELDSLKNTFQQEHPDFYSNVFEATINAQVAEATGNQKDLDFNNKLSDIQIKYQNHKFDKNPENNAKAYRDTLKNMLGNYSPDSSEYRKVSELVASAAEDVVDLSFSKEYEKIYNAYKLDNTQKGREKFLNNLNKLKNNSEYAAREDIISKIDSEVATATGDFAVGAFKKDLSDLQKKLTKGKLKDYGDAGASTYISQIQKLKDQYFGEGVDVKLGPDYKNLIESELQGVDGSLLYKTLQNKLSEFTNKYERGEIGADQIRGKILDWQKKGYFGKGQNVQEELNQSLTSIETEIAKKSYETYTKSTQKQIESLQERAARTFRTQEASFSDIQSSYQAGKTSFEAYEASRKSQASVQQKYEDYLKRLQQAEIPEFKFEEYKPGTTYKQKTLQDLGISEFTL